MDILLGSLLLLLEGVVPDEGDGIDVVLVGGDGEASLDEAEGFEVALEEIAAGGGGGIGLALEIGAVVLEGLEVVFEVLSLALGVIEDDEVAEGPVEVELSGFLLEDGEHDVGTGAGRRRGGRARHYYSSINSELRKMEAREFLWFLLSGLRFIFLILFIFFFTKEIGNSFSLFFLSFHYIRLNLFFFFIF